MDARESAQPRSGSGRRRLLGAVVFLLFVIPVVIRALTMPSRFMDIDVYIGAVRTALDGGDLYAYVTPDGFHFNYPPFAILVLAPLGMVPTWLGYALWSLTLVPLLAIVIATAGGPAAAAWVKRYELPLAIPLLVMFVVLAWTVPVWKTLGYGQIGVLLAALILVDCLWCRDKRWHGALIGVASAIKLTPLVFIAHLVLTKRWRAAGVASATFVGVHLLSALVLPSASWEYWTGVVMSGGRFGTNVLGNRSVHGMLQRTSLDEPVQVVLLIAIVAVLIIVGLLRARIAYQSGQFVVATAIIGCVSIAASPVAWSHHLIWIAVAALALAYPGRAVIPAVALAAIMMLDTPGLGQEIYGALGWGAALWTLVGDLDGLAAIAVILCLPVRRRAEPGVPVHQETRHVATATR